MTWHCKTTPWALLVAAGLLVIGGDAMAASGGAGAAFLNRLHEKFPNTAGAVVAPAFAGFWSVVKDGQVVYVKQDLSLMITGDVVDLQRQESMSARLLKAHVAKIRFADVPLQNAIPFAIGSPATAGKTVPSATNGERGRRRVVVFSDPDCPYCKQLEAELALLKDAQLYVLPYPLTQLHPQADQVAKAIWCQPDRSKAWKSYLIDGLLPQGRSDCANPIDANLALGKKLQINATPTLVFEDGTVIQGAISAARIEAQLSASASSKP